MAKIMSMTANAEKDFIEKMEQQHFKECCRQKFIGMIGDLENKLPKVVELVNANNIKK